MADSRMDINMEHIGDDNQSIGNLSDSVQNLVDEHENILLNANADEFEEEEEVAVQDEDDGIGGQILNTESSRQILANAGTDITDLREGTEAVSERCRSKKTRETYESGCRLWIVFYLRYINPNGNPWELTAESPSHIAQFLYYNCEDEKTMFLHGGEHVFCLGRKYSQAIKLRASLSWKFSSQYSSYKEPFRCTTSISRDGTTTPIVSGNPVLSRQVRDYMKSMKKRKLAAGEAPLSVKSVTFTSLDQNTLTILYFKCYIV